MQLFEIKALSEASCRFYRVAMQQVDDYNIRRIFQQRFEIYQQLLNLTASQQAQPNAPTDERLTQAVKWFEAAQSSIDNFDNLIFLDFLDAHENVALDALKQGVKESNDDYMSANLAQCAASLQVNHDALISLKAQYRNQQPFSPV